MSVLKKSCSPNSSLISNIGIISSDKRLITFADTDKIMHSHRGDGRHLYYRGAVEHSMLFYISSAAFYHSATKSLFLFT